MDLSKVLSKFLYIQEIYVSTPVSRPSLSLFEDRKFTVNDIILDKIPN